MEQMEGDFRKLKEAGINSVVALVKWLIDAKLIDDAIETKQKVEKMFQDVTDKSNVEWDKFLQVVTALTKERQQTTEQAFKQLTDALSAGIVAFVEAVKQPSPTPSKK